MATLKHPNLMLLCINLPTKNNGQTFAVLLCGFVITDRYLFGEIIRTPLSLCELDKMFTPWCQDVYQVFIEYVKLNKYLCKK